MNNEHIDTADILVDSCPDFSVTESFELDITKSDIEILGNFFGQTPVRITTNEL